MSEEKEYLKDLKKETGAYTQMFQRFSIGECLGYMRGIEAELPKTRGEAEEIMWKRHLRFVYVAFTKRKKFLSEEESYRIWKEIRKYLGEK